MISLVHTPPSAPPSLSQILLSVLSVTDNGNEERTFQALTHQGWNEPRLPDTIESANLLSSQPPTVCVSTLLLLADLLDHHGSMNNLRTL